MKPIAIIRSRVWRHRNGHTCSIYGVRPFGKDEDWQIEERGFTTRNDNGTVGSGRLPFKTLAEAQAKYPSLPIEIA